MKTTVIHIRNKTEHPDEVYIGRGGPFGNPIVIGKKCPVCEEQHNSGGSTLPCYERYLHKRLDSDPVFRAQVKVLHGKILVCFCKPKPCHGDVLALVTEQLYNMDMFDFTTED